MLSIAGLTYQRNGRLLFQDIGLTLFPGAILCINGKNGQGKTSLLRILAALSEPSSGEMCYNQCNIRKALDEYFSLVTYIAHKNSLDLELTVYENLLFWARLYHMEEGLEAAVAYFGLEPYLSSKVHELSIGWQRKVELAKLLLNQAVVWLLDEPFANLDPDGVKQVVEMIKTRCSHNGIVIFTGQESNSREDLNAINLCLGDFQHE